MLLFIARYRSHLVNKEKKVYLRRINVKDLENTQSFHIFQKPENHKEFEFSITLPGKKEPNTSVHERVHHCYLEGHNVSRSLLLYFQVIGA